MSDTSSYTDPDDADIEFIPEDEVVESEGLKKKAKKKLSELEACKVERQEYLDGWQRSQADYANLKKRMEEDKKNIGAYAVEAFIQDLLPTLDAFDMAFGNKESWEAVDANWRAGIEFIHGSLIRTLEERGVTLYDPLGEDFNAELHNSLEMVAVENEEQEGKIISVIQKGYKMGDRIIRVPNVRVGEVKES